MLVRDLVAVDEIAKELPKRPTCWSETMSHCMRSHRSCPGRASARRLLRALRALRRLAHGDGMAFQAAPLLSPLMGFQASPHLTTSEQIVSIFSVSCTMFKMVRGTSLQMDNDRKVFNAPARPPEIHCREK